MAEPIRPMKVPTIFIFYTYNFAKKKKGDRFFKNCYINVWRRFLKKWYEYNSF